MPRTGLRSDNYHDKCSTNEGRHIGFTYAEWMANDLTMRRRLPEPPAKSVLIYFLGVPAPPVKVCLSNRLPLTRLGDRRTMWFGVKCARHATHAVDGRRSTLNANKIFLSDHRERNSIRSLFVTIAKSILFIKYVVCRCFTNVSHKKACRFANVCCRMVVKIIITVSHSLYIVTQTQVLWRINYNFTKSSQTCAVN